MSELRSLYTLLEHEQRQRDELLAQMRQAQARLLQVQTQAEQLDHYRGEYQQRWTTQFSSAATGAALLQCYQSFGERLHQAVDQQQQAQSLASTQCERARQALQAQELRVAAVGKLIERRLAQARAAENKRDQKRNDEAAARLATSSGWNHPGGAAP
ncbi:flagellar export protein FliJ [Azohydromonas lata]|uniref:Flagellar FliJ protein n=1 Tax=Azohydromonas lata TaxID=45677 RepID=A0ABU5INY9_9BURK|nr:flagellar export protein FliJ [Azohydromonas lata]MDZ5460605.1 flagellar export protein FliJ [Azohydromonas lata]